MQIIMRRVKGESRLASWLDYLGLKEWLAHNSAANTLQQKYNISGNNKIEQLVNSESMDVDRQTLGSKI